MAGNSYDSSEQDSSARKGGGKDDKKLLELAKERFKLANDAEDENRRLALADIEFLNGDQWDEEQKQSRAQDGRPCLVINKLPQSVQQITNDQRQNRPSIKVHPVDDGGDPETAKVYSGLIRHIEYNSNADAAYDTAFSFAVKGGLGYYRVITAYADAISFEQEILIKRIKNPFSVFFDPYSVEPDGSDACFAFITEDLSKDEYKARYPKSKLAQRGEWESAVGNNPSDWMNSESARVAEYFYKETKTETIALLSNGQTLLKSKLSDAMIDEQGLPVSIVKEREAQVPKICWVKMNGIEVLEKTDWLGKYIPIIPVYGDETDIDGKRVLKGIVRDAKDSVRMYNYFASAESEVIALAPKAPFIADPKQIEGYENIWATANRKNHSFLPYNMIVSGQVLPPPQRSIPDVSTQAITQARMLAADDIKATTGIFDATLGNKSNESSGVAIQRRNMQAQTSNFHFIDNLTRSLRHTGRILIDLIPKVYDTARTARIIGEDGEQRVVKINDPTAIEPGKEKPYMLDAGKYDVTVDVGPSFQTKRQEAVASMLDFVKAYPMAAQFIGDLLAKNMDWPQATEIADRLKKTLPPQLQDDPKNQGNELPPQVQAQMQQMGQMVEQLTGKLNQLQGEKEQKLIELESKERIEMAKIQADIEINMAKLGSMEGIELLRQEVAQIESRLQMLRMSEPIPNQDSQPVAGGLDPAMGEPVEQNPTGGVLPGTFVEGNNHVDPSHL